jgi:hypothetical protein
MLVLFYIILVKNSNCLTTRKTRIVFFVDRVSIQRLTAEHTVQINMSTIFNFFMASWGEEWRERYGKRVGPSGGVSDALGANKTPSEELVASAKDFRPLALLRQREFNVS